MLCISLRTPIKEEHYHLRSTHTQRKKLYEGRKKKTKIIVPFDYKTHTHAEKKDTNMFKDRKNKTFYYKQRKQYIKRKEKANKYFLFHIEYNKKSKIEF